LKITSEVADSDPESERSDNLFKRKVEDNPSMIKGSQILTLIYFINNLRCKCLLKLNSSIMAMTFSYYTFEEGESLPVPALEGAIVELYTFRAGFRKPHRHLSVVTSGKAVFQNETATSFAVLVRIGAETIARTGIIGQESGLLNEQTGDLDSYYIIQEDGSPIVITTDQLKNSMPEGSTTYDDENGSPVFRIDDIDIDIEGDRCVTEGKGEYLGGGAGNITFSYDFRLHPDWSLTDAGRILRVETVSCKVKSVNRGFWGAINNFFVNIVLWVLRNRLSETIKDAVQQIVNNEIDRLIDDTLQEREIDKEGLTVTIRSSAIDASTGITVHPAVLINALSLCPTRMSSAKMDVKSRSGDRSLKLMRDSVLKGTKRGERYVRLFELHRKESVRLLLTQPDLLKQAVATLETGIHDFRGDEPGKGVMSEATALEAAKLLKMIEELAASGISDAAGSLVKEIQDFAGQRVDEVMKRDS
jgi:hypothetical protein